jgi:hypothetical protein
MEDSRLDDRGFRATGEDAECFEGIKGSDVPDHAKFFSERKK